MSILQPAAKTLAKRVVNFGTSHRCSFCNSYVRQFSAFVGPIPRSEAHPPTECPVCGSHNRHRMIWLWLQRKTDLFDGRRKKVLHVAPEHGLSRMFRKLPYLDYITADRDNPAMVRMDITAIQVPDNSFDVILCSHVLEHIPEDRLAMSELFRVLKPGGWAWLQVPITAERTFEDPSVTTPEARGLIYGHVEHVRRYGLDYRNRLEQAGFSVQTPMVTDEFEPDEVQRFGLLSDEDRMIWYCRKNPPKGQTLR